MFQDAEARTQWESAQAHRQAAIRSKCRSCQEPRYRAAGREGISGRTGDAETAPRLTRRFRLPLPQRSPHVRHPVPSPFSIAVAGIHVKELVPSHVGNRPMVRPIIGQAGWRCGVPARRTRLRRWASANRYWVSVFSDHSPRIGTGGRPSSSKFTATYVTSASVRRTTSPLRSVSTTTRMVIDVRPTRTTFV